MGVLSPDLLTLVLLAAITFGLVLSRTNAAFVTFTLCAGYVLSDSVTPNVDSVIREVVNPGSLPLTLIIHLVLLLLPPLVIWHRFRRTQRGGGRFIMQLVPAFGLALLFVILIFEQLPSGGQEILQGESYFHGQIREFRNWLVLYAIASAMFDVLTQHAGPKRPYHRRKKRDDD